MDRPPKLRALESQFLTMRVRLPALALRLLVALAELIKTHLLRLPHLGTPRLMAHPRLTECHPAAVPLLRLRGLGSQRLRMQDWDRLSKLLPPRSMWTRKREPLGFRLLALKVLVVLAAVTLEPQRLTMRDRLPVLALRLLALPEAPLLLEPQ